MSDCFDHQMDALDRMLEGEEEPTGSNYYYLTIKCKYCGKRGLGWGQHEGNWRLFDEETEELHSCHMGR